MVSGLLETTYSNKHMHTIIYIRIFKYNIYALQKCCTVRYAAKKAASACIIELLHCTYQAVKGAVQ